MLGNVSHMLGNRPHLCISRVMFIMGRLGWVVCLSWPSIGLGNGLHMLGNGPHL